MGVQCHLLGNSRSLYLPRFMRDPNGGKELFMPHKTLVGNLRGKTHRPVCAVVTVACMLAVVAKAQDQPKRYDLKLTWKAAVEGHKSELSKDESKVMMMKVLNSDGKALTQEDKELRTFAAVEVISKVKDGKAAVSRWSFTTATQHRGDEEIPFAFQGRTVVITRDPASKPLFAFDDGEPVATDDATVLAELWDSDSKPGELSGEEIFAPKKPVAVGEQWMPDVAVITQGLKLGDGIDLKRSSAKATLKSAETRDGVEFGNIELSVDLWLTKIGPMQLDNPVLMKLEADIDACIDGALPDGTMRATMKAKGDSPASMEDSPTRVRVSFDLEAKVLERQKTVK